MKVFRPYLKEKKVNEPQTKDTLAKVLELFYAEADGTSYSVKEHIKQPQIWIKSAFQSYSWF